MARSQFLASAALPDRHHHSCCGRHRGSVRPPVMGPTATSAPAAKTLELGAMSFTDGHVRYGMGFSVSCLADSD